MQMLNREEILHLMGDFCQPCLSLYQPTHRVGPETQQDPIRFRNLLKQAEEMLIDDGMRPATGRAMLEPAQGLLQDQSFWLNASDGLAIFISPDTFRHYRLPHPFTEKVVLNRRFHIRPLLPLLNSDGHFYLLALSQKKARLFSCTRFSIEEVEIRNTPTSLDEVLQYDDVERQIQYHTSAPAGRSGGAVVFHGHGSTSDEARHRADLLRFLHELDKGVVPLVQPAHTPVILAAVNYLGAFYRGASSLSLILDETLEGNPEKQTDEQLHQAAWDIARGHFERQSEGKIALYAEKAGSQLVSDNLREIIPAARTGRIQYLFVATEGRVDGTWSPAQNRVILHRTRKGDDLLDMATRQALIHGGVVFATEPEKIPNGQVAAAILRY